MTVLRSSQNPKVKDWSYDVITDSYRHISGVTVDRIDIDRNNGDLETVLDNALKMASVGATGAAQGDVTMRPLGTPYSIIYNGPPPSYQSETTTDGMVAQPIDTLINVGNFQKNLTIQTGLGDIAINLTTGYMSIPPGVGRADAIREFWLGFQKHFQPLDKKSYDDKILKLERELAVAKTSAALMRAENQKEASKRVAEKIAKKYGNEKFIMMKPADLIKFIEEE
jgi:hypothetical protein